METKNKKAYLQISFAWLFAIIVGAFILALAFFAVTKIIGIGETKIDAETSARIGALLHPLETGFASMQSVPISLPSETRLSFSCDESGNFGNQRIEVSQKSFGEFTKGFETRLENKYVFANKEIEDENFYLLSIPFKSPFKVSNVIIVTPASENYCFIDSPSEVAEQIASIQGNIKTSNCTGTDKKICFNNDDCEVNVAYAQGRVEKDGETVYFSDNSLMYAAIFSNQINYECNVKRLMKRVGILSRIYSEKANFVEQKECHTDLNQELLQLQDFSDRYSDSNDLVFIENLVETIDDQNKLAVCKLW